MNKTTSSIKTILFVSVCIASLVLTNCRDRREAEECTGKIAAKPFAEFQGRLLDIAFETASAIPAEPWIKDRSKAQQGVVETCLKLNRPARALGYIDGIDNWRRGLCYAETGLYLAKRNHREQAEQCLSSAENTAAAESEQEWRTNRIRARIAQAYAVLGQSERADEFSEGVGEADLGAVTVTRSSMADEDAFDEYIKAFDGMVALIAFEPTINACYGYVELFGRFYDNPQRRSTAEAKIRTAWKSLPAGIHLDIIDKLVEAALEHGDNDKALEWIDEAQGILDGTAWASEELILKTAEVAKLRSRAGAVDKARKDADTALALFNERREGIFNINRAGVLRALAEAYMLMGDSENALNVYKMAVDEGVVNPNPRPRAEDLSATCSSMALYGIEPDGQLWTRISQVAEEINDQ